MDYYADDYDFEEIDEAYEAEFEDHFLDELDALDDQDDENDTLADE